MQRLVKNSLGQEATQLLRKMILNGHFEHGQRLVEDRIATDLGISRTPLREALHRLAQEGLLEKRPTGGYILRPLERTEIEDAITIRTMLESYATKLAAERCTEAQKIALQENLASFKNACRAEDIPRLVELNEAFHALLRECARSPLLMQLLIELDGITERMLRPIISVQEAEWTYTDHAGIVDFVMQGDGQGAHDAMHAHVMHGKNTLLTQLDEKQEK